MLCERLYSLQIWYLFFFLWNNPFCSEDVIPFSVFILILHLFFYNEFILKYEKKVKELFKKYEITRTKTSIDKRERERGHDHREETLRKRGERERKRESERGFSTFSVRGFFEIMIIGIIKSFLNK